VELSAKNKLYLYKIAVEEYRFEVRLGWDRTTYFLGLNAAILTVATGLLKLENPAIVYLFIALLFMFGVATSVAGARSILRAHEYYRNTIVKKTGIEEHLGLSASLPGLHESFNLAIGTTTGQSERLQILNDPKAWVDRPLRKRSITFFVNLVLYAMAGVNGIGVVMALFLLFQKATSVIPIATEHIRPLF
jgi:hypothetical protein